MPDRQAPTRGAPLQTPSISGPSQEERLLAAAGYLGYFTGFWLVVPIVVYVFKREKSRFVAHHAIRGVLLHLVAVPIGILCTVLSMAVGIGTMMALGPKGGRGNEDVAAGVFVLFVWGSWILPFLIYFVVTVLAAIRAFQGRTNRGSLFGRIAEWFLRQDRTVAPWND